MINLNDRIFNVNYIHYIVIEGNECIVSTVDNTTVYKIVDPEINIPGLHKYGNILINLRKVIFADIEENVVVHFSDYRCIVIERQYLNQFKADLLNKG